MNVKEIITRGYSSYLGFVVDDDVGVVRHDHVISEGRLVHGVLPPLVLEDAVDHGVVGTRGGQGGVRHQGAVHAVPEAGSLRTKIGKKRLSKETFDNSSPADDDGVVGRHVEVGARGHEDGRAESIIMIFSI